MDSLLWMTCKYSWYSIIYVETSLIMGCLEYNMHGSVCEVWDVCEVLGCGDYQCKHSDDNLKA